jgi:three-Cys-motif partner protein
MKTTDAAPYELQEHTRAKHQVLRTYLNSWLALACKQGLKLPKNSAHTVLLVDGFSGPGRFRGGEPGSALIMLETLTSHSAFPHCAALDFHFLLIERSAMHCCNLDHEVSRLPLPANVRVQIAHAEAEESLGTIVERMVDARDRRTPTFSFIDPFRNPSVSLSMNACLMDFLASDTLLFLPLSPIQRMIDQDVQVDFMKALFDCEEWRLAVCLTGQEQQDSLCRLFEERLRTRQQAKFTSSFELKPIDEIDYRCFFTTSQEKNVELFKRAMWDIDQSDRTRYLAYTRSGHAVPFANNVDTSPLLAELKSEFSGRWFDMKEAEQSTILHTPFVVGSHLRQKTLAPAENLGVLEVVRPEGVRRGAFVDGVLMRFI